MLGLVDYSSSAESSDESADAMVEAQAPSGNAKIPEQDFSDSVTVTQASKSMSVRCSTTKISSTTPARQFDHVPGQWAVTAILTGAQP